MFAPVDVNIKYTDGTTETKYVTPAAWEKDPKQAMVSINTKKKIESVSLDGGIFVDADKSNNRKPADKKAF